MSFNTTNMYKPVQLFILIFFTAGQIKNMSNEIILIADKRILDIPVIENHEQLIDLKNQKEILYGPSPEIPDNQDYTKLRLTVYNKLIEAQKLLPRNLRFCIYEGYRSLEMQEQLFEKHHKQIKERNPEWTQERWFEETTKLVSPVINKDGSKNIPPHSTGAAFDIYLVDENSNPINMGIYVKDWLQDISGELSAMNSEKISDEAKINRKIMRDALEAVGFVNYPTEYWHWSYGDRYWAYHKNFKHAIYSTLERDLMDKKPEMRKFLQNKLWRDKANEILEKQHGSVIHWRRLDDKEFDDQLKLKLVEESEEVKVAKTRDELISELADVFEVIDSLCKLNNISKEEIIAAQKTKVEKRGSFEGRKYITIAEHLENSFGEKYCLADPTKYPEIK